MSLATPRQGQVGIEPAPRHGGRARFAVFESHEYGIRALAMLLTTYQDRHGLRTVRRIINRWAPPKENDTGAYVRGVAAALGVAPDAAIDLQRYETMRPMVEAIIRHELGGQPYAAATIDAGLKLAGLSVPPLASGTVKAAAVRTRGAVRRSPPLTMGRLDRPGAHGPDGIVTRRSGAPCTLLRLLNPRDDVGAVWAYRAGQVAGGGARDAPDVALYRRRPARARPFEHAPWRDMPVAVWP